MKTSDHGERERTATIMGGIMLSLGSGLFTSALVAFALAATPLLADAAAAALLIFFSGITFIVAGGALHRN